MKRGGGEARAAGGAREEEDGAREGDEKPEACLLIRERCEQTGAKIEGEPNNGHPPTHTPRFSGDIKDEDPLGDDVIKVFCVFKR